MKFLKQQTTPEESRRMRLERECSKLIRRLNDIRNTLNFVEDEKLINALIYEENAVLCLLDELFKSARAEGISIQPHERHKL